MINEWIATEWTHSKDENDYDSRRITIHRMTSPFYTGVRYAVRRGERTCLTTKGEWEFEPLPSSRTDVFYRRCRFMNFEDAVKAADTARLHLRAKALRAQAGGEGAG